MLIPTEWFRWLPLAAVRLFLPGAGPARPGPRDQSAGSPGQGRREVPIDRRAGTRLAAVDHLRPTQRSQRVGWLFVASRVVAADGRSRRVFHPLVTVPVRADRLGGTRLLPVDDVEVSDRWTDKRAELVVRLVNDLRPSR